MGLGSSNVATDTGSGVATDTPSGVSGGGSGAIIFDDSGGAAVKSNIRSARALPSPIDNTKTGITNLGSDSTGLSAGVTGDYATNLGGDKNAASGAYATVGGRQSVADGLGSVAIGNVAQAMDIAAVALGSSVAFAEGSVAAGSICEADGLGAVALGKSCTAGEDATVAIGGTCTAVGSGGVALGSDCHSGSDGAIAMGDGCTSTGLGSVALGTVATASGDAAVALGASCSATGNYSFAQGVGAVGRLAGQYSRQTPRISTTGPKNAQSSSVILQGFTPGVATNEACDLTLPDGTEFSCENGRAYRFTVDVIATSSPLPGTVRGFVQRGVVRVTAGGVATLAGVDTQVPYGDSVIWTVVISCPAASNIVRVHVATGVATTAKLFIQATVHFDELDIQ